MKIKVTMIRSLSLILLFHLGAMSFLEAQDSFITTWEIPTNAANTSITIPTTGSGYLYDVDWGDGSTSSGHVGSATHSYGTPGTYTVRIIGDFPRIYFNGTGDKDRIISIDQWGDIAWQSMSNAFNGCSNLGYAATDSPNLTAVSDMSYMFFSASSFDGDLNGWNVSNVTEMSNMFTFASLFNGDINSWDVSSVNSMSEMFALASSFNQDLSDWDVSNVATMSFMFYQAGSFDQDLGDWDLTSIVNIEGMLDFCGMLVSSYDNTLIGWASNPNTPSDLILGASNLKYCNGDIARDSILIDNLGWSTNDSGSDCTTVCRIPRDTEANVTTSTDALITWPAVSGAIKYQVWYREKGTSPWTIKASSPLLTRVLSGLSPKKYYQYKIRSTCVVTAGWSDFSDIEMFYTSTCDIPTGISSLYLDSTRMKIRWDNTGGIRCKVRYRAVNTHIWYTKNSIPGNNFVYITGLNPSTKYEYRVRSNCAGSDWSAYSSLYCHNLVCRLPAKEVARSSKIYPNPVRDMMNIEFETGMNEEVNIIISDHLGKVIRSTNESYPEGIQRENIDMSPFANGYYFLTIQADDMLKTFKFMKVE